MSYRDGTMNTYPERTLADSLRALPDATPQPDIWPELARTLAARRRKPRWRRTVPAALAAGFALALLLPAHLRHAPGDLAPAASVASPHAAPAVDRNELANLHGRSKTLERWIAAVAARAPQDSRDLMAAVEVEDLIGLVDVQLGAARDDADALPLWRQRVALLEDLATIRGSAYAIAANDDSNTDAMRASLPRVN